jgi:hypothetical protein
MNEKSQHESMKYRLTSYQRLRAGLRYGVVSEFSVQFAALARGYVCCLEPALVVWLEGAHRPRFCVGLRGSGLVLYPAVTAFRNMVGVEYLSAAWMNLT